MSNWCTLYEYMNLKKIANSTFLTFIGWLEVYVMVKNLAEIRKILKNHKSELKEKFGVKG